MKLITNPENKVISVVGLSSSGTTIVNNIFESMDNGFCISEPHWVLLSRPRRAKFGKIGNLNYNNVYDIIPAIRRLIDDSAYVFGGVKETYRVLERRMTPVYDIMFRRSDIVIFVFRNPIFLLNSLRRKNSRKVSFKSMARNYKSLYSVMKGYRGNKVCVVSEDLSDAGNDGVIPYLNKQANGLFEIKGPFQLNRSKFIYGNDKAHRSTKILPTNTRVKLVQPHEAEKVTKILGGIYTDIRNNF